ncbi:MAG TPA: hypothetical protein VLB83_04955 [Candidatus Paceibacterota bacterium]|nr:hypothetical protein [Candidatus Paceibacterota bacterium]
MGAWFMRGLLFVTFFGGNIGVASVTIYGGWRISRVLGYDARTVAIMGFVLLLLIGTLYGARLFLRICEPGVFRSAIALGTRIAWVAVTFTFVRDFVATSSGDLFIFGLLVFALLVLANVPMVIAEAMLCVPAYRKKWNVLLAELDEESSKGPLSSQ